MEATSRSAPAAPCRLLRLPAELREYIYELVIFPRPQDQKTEAWQQQQQQAHGEFASKTHFGYHLTFAYVPSPILAVSRQIRVEASKVFYTRSKFFRYNFDYLQELPLRMRLGSLEPADKQLVTRFKLDGYDEGLPMGGEDVVAQKRHLLGLGAESFEFKHLTELVVRDDSVDCGWRYANVEEVPEAEE